MQDINIKDRISKYYASQSVNRLEDFLTQKCWFDIIDKRNSETAHSSFIAWLLNSNESHQLGIKPCFLFLNTLRCRILTDEQKKSMPQDLENAILTKKIHIEKVETTTEKSTTNGRVDILTTLSLSENIQIKGNSYKYIRLVIENKIGTKEHDNQTQKYHKYFNNNPNEGFTGGNIFYVYIFLTADSTAYLDMLTEPECDDKTYIQTNYQDIYDQILTPILSTTLSEKTRNCLEEYVKCLSISKY